MATLNISGSLNVSNVTATSAQVNFALTITESGSPQDSGYNWILSRIPVATGTPRIIATSTFPPYSLGPWPAPTFFVDTGLTTETEYYYQLSITPYPGHASGAVVTSSNFTTQSSLFLGSLNVLSIGSSTVSLSHQSAQGGIPSYSFQWYRNLGSSTFTPGPGTILSGQTGVTLNDTGRSPSTTYGYICVVTDSAGYTANSSQVTLTTNAALAISTPTVGIVGAVNANLVASAATGGNPSYTYQWYRSTSGSGFTPGPGNILSGRTSLILADTGLTPATTYYYKIVATDSIADTIISSAATVLTANDLTIAAPTLNTTTATTSSFSATAAVGGLLPYSYQWYRSTVSGFTPSNSNVLVGQVELTLADSGLSPSTTYYYIIQVVDAALDVTNSDPVVAVTLAAPLLLGELTANSVGQTGITITSPNATGGAPAYSYAWYRSEISGDIGSLLSGQTTQTITDSGLTANTQYFYTCRVTDSASPTPATADSPQLGIITTAVSTLGDYYADLLAIEYIGQPNFYTMIQQLANMATLPATSTQTADDILPLVIQNAFNIATAKGTQLDILGKYLGVSRHTTNFNGVSITLSDSDFQTLIKLAASVRISGNSVAAIDRFLYNNFPGQVFLTDNENMSISYLINSTIGSQDLIDAFISEQLLPKPMGVQISSIIVNPSLNFFGFSFYGPDGTWIPAAPLVQGFQTYSSYNMNSPWLTYEMAIATGI